MPARDPICSVSGCGQPTEGFLIIPTPEGSRRLSACEAHGRRSSNGEWLIFELSGSKYYLGERDATAHRVRYHPLRA